jgi:hypothetical protein
MKYSGWIRVLGIAILGTGWLMSVNTQAQANERDGYSSDDLAVQTANDLFDVCTIDTAHSEYDLATGFCYGFFEGAKHYDDALAGSGLHNDIVCSPEGGATRTQAVNVFIQYLKDNPQYGIEPPIDAIFRALIAKWPCSE